MQPVLGGLGEKSFTNKIPPTDTNFFNKKCFSGRTNVWSLHEAHNTRMSMGILKLNDWYHCLSCCQLKNCAKKIIPLQGSEST